jgi:hypothetical protein
MEEGDLECYTCVLCNGFLVETPRQAPCGERLCSPCWREHRNSGENLKCPKCGEKIVLQECFPDKALQQELTTLVLRCGNKDCSWKGLLNSYKAHRAVCRHELLNCVNCVNGECRHVVKREDMEEHVKTCVYSPIPCKGCSKPIPKCNIEEHMGQVCEQVLVSCPEGCGEMILRGRLKEHYNSECSQYVRHCSFDDLGCCAKGNSRQLSDHITSSTSEHLNLLKTTIDKRGKDVTMELEELRGKIKEMELRRSSESLKSMVQSVMKLETTIQQLQDGFGEMALLVQTLQATSYSGIFIWKIPEVTRRRHEARVGRTLSLYSAPFYTSRHGYKLCLRLYVAGDGSGKGSHLSFFMTIMRGEFDSLLRWPFRQTVSLVLLDQDRQRDIVQSFRPEPSSASFQRPRLEMNVASGCPAFAPLSVLDNSSYVKDDTLFLKCVIDRTGLENT